MPADLELVRRLAASDHGLAVVTTTRRDGSVHASVVNAGVLDDPITNLPAVGFVARGSAVKLRLLRRTGRATVVFRAGWEWVAVDGAVRVVGPDDVPEGFAVDRLPQLLREVFTAAGGMHEDWAEYDRVMVAERRVAVLIEPVFGSRRTADRPPLHTSEDAASQRADNAPNADTERRQERRPGRARSASRLPSMHAQVTMRRRCGRELVAPIVVSGEAACDRRPRVEGRDSGMARIWVADTEPNQRFTLYTRGNVGEVFPRVMTALTGTLIGDAVRQGQVEVFVEMGVLRRHEVTGPSVGTGVFGGYLYMSGSALRLFGVRMPGMSPRDADEQVMGEVTDVPPYRPARGDRDLIATLTLSRYVLKLLRSPDLGPLDLARADAQAWLATMPDVVSSSDEQLLGWLESFPPRQAASMKRLLEFSMLAGAPRGLLDRFLARVAAPPGLANRIVGGTGHIDSAQLARQLWALGRLVAADASLSHMFDVGLDGIEIRTRDTPLQPAIDTFLADHGHRGNDEYELATPAWAMDPAPVYAAIDRLRRAPADRDPIVVARQLAADSDTALAEASALVPRRMRWVLRRSAMVSRQGSIGRERAKDILVLENLGARRVLHELARRAAERGGPSDVRHAFCVTATELADFVARPTEFTQEITERSARQRYLDERIPPPWFDGHISDPATWPVRAASRPAVPAAGITITGIAVSGGIASGPARVILDPTDPRELEPGDVLVCPITDPSWTPMFLSVAAVVCDTGAVQSHAAIIARELGIPAVLSVPGITAVQDGTILHVNGDNGTVVIDPPRE